LTLTHRVVEKHDSNKREWSWFCRIGRLRNLQAEFYSPVLRPAMPAEMQASGPSAAARMPQSSNERASL